MKKQYYVRPMIRNDWEKLHEIYPEAKQMSYNNKGFDYIMENCRGINVRIEEKSRSNGVKVDITPTQEDKADVFALRTEDNRYYFLSAKKYLKLSKRHSAIASGWKGKSRELSQKAFIENATTDLKTLIDEIEHTFGTLEDFLG